MAGKKYSDFIEISPTFESVVDIDSDTRNANLWREYIVGDDMEEMMEKLCQSLNNEGPDARRSFWIEGTYGTGKSYAAILIKHLMEEKPGVVDAYLAQNSRLSAYRNRFMKCRAAEKGDYLVVWKTGCTGIRDGNALLMEAEEAVREALAAKFGEKADYGEASLQDAVKAKLDDSAFNWDNIIDQSDLGDDYGSADELRVAVDRGDLNALKKTAAVMRQKNLGLVDSLDTFKAWIASVIEHNGLSRSGIFFIWDEFTEYVVNSDDQTILQQLSEFCKVQPFFMLLIAHRTTAMEERLTPERYQLITHRFHQVAFHISADAAFDLIAGSINIRTGMENYWQEERRTVIRNIRPYVPEMDGLGDKIERNIEYLCPMHPMTIKLLSRVAENYAASQRTMFRFMKDRSTEDQGFVGYIHAYGPEDQACWLTPEWLWDYFFTRESDFSDKDIKAAEYIRHYEESRHLVENDENAFRVFKTAMLLMALMSSTKGIYSGRGAKDGIAATQECLKLCLAGVISEKQVVDLLSTMVDGGILVLDQDLRGNVRLQLPFKGMGQNEFDNRFAKKNDDYSRYKMFAKDGEFAQALEKQAWDQSDAMLRRMKIAVCCAEVKSINARLDEITKDLEKHPYKLGLLIVTVASEQQANTVQADLKKRAAELDEARLTIALDKAPLTEEKRREWLKLITQQELAGEMGQTGSANNYKMDAAKIIGTWVSAAASGKIVAYHQEMEFRAENGLKELARKIRTNVLDVVFEYAPEHIVQTNTAYKSCNKTAPLVGIQRTTKNSQLKNVLKPLENAGMLELKSIDEMAAASETKEAKCVAALARLVRSKMESGSKVRLDELWQELQQPPFGYYNTIACGVLLGYVFSSYLNSRYTWTDSVQSPHILAEQTINNMVAELCAGKMTTDYLSAGSLTWQHFSEYLAKIFDLSPEQLAEQTTGYHNVREAVTKSGAPFWALKYLPDEAWSSAELRETGDKVINHIQVFITQEGDVEEAMSDVLQLMSGRRASRVRKVLEEAFQDKDALAGAFRSFLFGASQALAEVATRLSVPPQELSDKLHSVMQGAIYTWTEDQVREKLADVAGDYRYIEALSKVQGCTYHNLETARSDLANQFKFLRIALAAVEQLGPAWYPALAILRHVAAGGALHLSAEEKEREIAILEQHGAVARDCLRDGRAVLSDILAARGVDCTQEELSAVYHGLKGLSCDATLTQFNKELDSQVHRISFARNKTILQETWRSLSGMDSVKDWCTKYAIPLLWVVPKECQTAFETLVNMQKKDFVVDTAVVSAINVLKSMDAAILTEQVLMEQAFMALVGEEYQSLWDENRGAIVMDAKMKIGNDMSSWSTADLRTVQDIFKKMQQDKAKKEQLAEAKQMVRTMEEDALRDRVEAFLEAHPEFCEALTR